MVRSSDQLFDKRLIERHLDQGVVTRRDYENHLANLADASENVDVIAFDADDDSQESALA